MHYETCIMNHAQCAEEERPTAITIGQVRRDPIDEDATWRGPGAYEGAPDQWCEARAAGIGTIVRCDGGTQRLD